nr:MAG TPA: hypothetical protein [Caudoviricetes sp.]
MKIIFMIMTMILARESLYLKSSIGTVTLLIVKQFKEISGLGFIVPTYMTNLSLSN